MARIFVAILLPDDVVTHLHEHLDALRTARPDLRWIAPQNYHLTVRFLGECGPREVDRQIDHWSGRAAQSAPLNLRLHGAGTFPHDWAAKVLFADVAGDRDAFTALAGPQQQPHVTLARTRQSADLSGAVLELSSYVGPPWQAREIAVVRSYLRGSGERGPRYEPIERLALTGR